MMPVVRRCRQSGLTLLEVLVAIILVSTTLVAFASVYPAAFKANRKSHRAVQAAEYASAVAEELRAMPVSRPSLTISEDNKFYLEDFEDNAWTPGRGRFPVASVPPPFSLMSRTNQNGVLVQRADTVAGPSKFWLITVTIYWQEPVNHTLVDRSVSIISSRTGNR